MSSHVPPPEPFLDAIEALRDLTGDKLLAAVSELAARFDEEPELWFFLAESGLGPPDRSFEELVETGVERAPGDPWVRLRAAEILFESGRSAAARPHLRHDDLDSAALVARMLACGAGVLHDVGEHRRARRIEHGLRTLVADVPDEPAFAAMLCSLLVHQGRHAEARATVCGALTRAPDDEHLAFWLEASQGPRWHHPPSSSTTPGAVTFRADPAD
jgi:predicted Zn-dependent protease